METSLSKPVRALLLTILFSTSVYAHAIEIRGARSCGLWINGKTNNQSGANEAWLLF